MTAKITVNTKTNRVIVDLGNHSRVHRQVIRDGFYDLGKITQKEMRRLIKTGPKTGLIYRRRNRPNHQASAPGEAPANDSGDMAKSADYSVRDDQMEIGYKVSYAKIMEFGARVIKGDKVIIIKPRPSLRPAVRTTSSIAIELFHGIARKKLRV